MADGRWYPSVVNTRGGYALIVGGFNGSGNNSKTSEVYGRGTGATIRGLATASSPCTRTSSLLPTPSTSSPVRDGPSLLKTPTARPGYFHPGFWEPFNGNKFKKVNDLTMPTHAASAPRAG